MKVGGILCEISSKKWGGLVWAQKKKKKKREVFSGVDSQKMESFSVQKCNFKPKFANFMLNCHKIVKFLKMHFNLYVKFDTKVEKGDSLGVD